MFKWVSDKHRLVLFNDDTFQEERSVRLSRGCNYVLDSHFCVYKYSNCVDHYIYTYRLFDA